jgi:hypothetical protein
MKAKSNIIDFNLPFAKRGEEVFNMVVNHPLFIEDDKNAASLIVSCLGELKPISVSDCLKNYISAKHGLSGDSGCKTEECKKILLSSFKETGTPFSVEPTTSKPSQLAKNWLTQATVKPSVISLLGMGLGMKIEEVSSLRMNALGKRDFFLPDPEEAINCYCIKNGLGYSDACRMKKIYENSQRISNGSLYSSEKDFVEAYMNASDERTFIELLLAQKGGPAWDSNGTAFCEFKKLFRQCQEAIAENYYGEDNLDKFEKKPEDVTETDLEKSMCSGVPYDNNNPRSLSRSSINKAFNFKRCSRNRLFEVRSRASEVDRTDLINLSFILANEKGGYQTIESCYGEFVKSTNKILKECFMGELNFGNPYDCYMLICMSSNGPLDIYAEVWKKSFEQGFKKLAE